MRAGTLDRQIVIQKKAPTQGSSGEEIQGWTAYKTTWANARPMTATEQFESGADRTKRSYVFTMRWDAGIDPTMRIVYQSLNWRITGIEEIGRREGLKVTAETVYAGGL